MKMRLFGSVAAAMMMTVLPATDVFAAPAKTPVKKATVKKPWRLDVSKMKFTLTTDKNPIAYKVGDEIVFRVIFDWGQEVPEDQKKPLFVQWSRSGDDGIAYNGMESIAPGKDVIIKTKLDRPGFVRMTGRLLDVTGKGFVYFKHGEIRTPLVFDAGAGCNVDELLPAATEPADFDAFWKETHALLAKVPVKATVKKLPDSVLPEKYQGKFTISAVTVQCAGPRPVTGYLYQKVGIKPKSMPVQVMFDGYGPGAQENIPMHDWFFSLAKEKIVFHINAHGYDLGKDAAYYKKFFAERPSYGFSMKENANPKTSYYHGMAMRVIRAFDFAKTLPGWNGKDLIAQGGSQGGLQTAWAGSQVKGLTLCRPSVTWCSDLAGKTIGRLGGWHPPYVKGLDYYDTVFHARRIPKSCKLEITRIGLGDYVCPPSGVAAQYNAANCPKKASWVQNSTHMYVPADKEEYIVEAPAGKGITGVAKPIPVERLEDVTFVNVKLDNVWTVTLPNGKVIKNVKLAERENLRKMYGLKTFDKITLKGNLQAEDDGYALAGVGADWWWTFKVNGEQAYARTRALPGGNANSAFRKTDWVFRAPVKKGNNTVEVEITMGEHGMVAIGTFSNKDKDLEIGKHIYDLLEDFTKKYPNKLSDEDIGLSRGLIFKKCFKFKTSQPYPAGVEYSVDGGKKWIGVWDPDFSTSHCVELPVDELKGKTVQLRVVQHFYEGGWEIVRSGVLKTITF